MKTKKLNFLVINLMAISYSHVLISSGPPSLAAKTLPLQQKNAVAPQPRTARAAATTVTAAGVALKIDDQAKQKYETKIAGETKPGTSKPSYTQPVLAAIPLTGIPWPAWEEDHKVAAEKTTTVLTLPVAHALNALESFVAKKEKGTPAIRPSNRLTADNQKKQMATVSKMTEQSENANVFFTDDELLVKASDDNKALNSLVKKHGFSIEFSPFSKSECGTTAILRHSWEWEGGGKQAKTEIFPYNAILLKKNTYFKLTNGKEVICIKTKPKHINNGFWAKSSQNPWKQQDVLWLTIADQPRAGFDLLNHVNTLKAHAATLKAERCHVKFPMVDAPTTQDITFLTGLQVGNYTVSQGKQATRIGWDEFGGFVKSCAAITSYRSIMPTIEINKPFFAWMTRTKWTEKEVNGKTIRENETTCPEPVFAAYMPRECWKKLR